MNNDEPTTGSLDTNVRLLAQRVTTTENDLKRLGDSMRQNARELSKLDANTSQNDKLLDYRLETIETKLKDIIESGKGFKNWLMGIFSGLVLTFLLALFEVLRKR